MRRYRAPVLVLLYDDRPSRDPHGFKASGFALARSTDTGRDLTYRSIPWHHFCAR